MMKNKIHLFTAAVALITTCHGFHSMEKLEQEMAAPTTYDHGKDLLGLASTSYPDGMAVQRAPKAGPDGMDAIKVTLNSPATSPYAMNLQFFHTNTWQVGDAGLIAFYARSLSTENRYGASSLMLQYKPDYADWRGHKETDLFLSNDWKLILLPFEVSIDAGTTDRMVLSFFLGGVDPHSFLLANLKVYNLGKTIAPDELPQSATYYPGIEPDAKWRNAARDRIEEHRKADLSLRVVDTDGTPVRGAKVDIELKRHKFGFGAAVHTRQLVSPDIPQEKRQAYSDILTRTCSKITPTNAMKWKYHHHLGQYVPDLVAWCKNHDMTLRGHLFIWPGYERLPEGYDLYKTDPAAFRKDLVEHIHRFANMYPDAFSEWDVMNEPYTETDYMDLLGKEVVLEWFNAARAANTNYLTYINDFGILTGNNQEHRDNYHDWIVWLIEQGAPLDGIGFQGHFRAAIPPELIYERIDRFAKFGKKMQITEFDFKHSDPTLQTRFFEDFVTLIFSHPQMDALINWIFLEDDFRPEAALYRKDFTPTPLGEVWERLLTKEWITQEACVTDEQGYIHLRGFKGIYQIEYTAAGSTHMLQLELDADHEQDLPLPGTP